MTEAGLCAAQVIDAIRTAATVNAAATALAMTSSVAARSVDSVGVGRALERRACTPTGISVAEALDARRQGPDCSMGALPASTVHVDGIAVANCYP